MVVAIFVSFKKAGRGIYALIHILSMPRAPKPHLLLLLHIYTLHIIGYHKSS